MKAVFKWLGIIAGALVGLLVLGILVLYGRGQMRLKKVYDIPKRTIDIPVDPESLVEGKRIFQYRGCEACHGIQLHQTWCPS
jgi:hypothetical protein